MQVLIRSGGVGAAVMNPNGPLTASVDSQPDFGENGSRLDAGFIQENGNVVQFGSVIRGNVTDHNIDWNPQDAVNLDINNLIKEHLGTCSQGQHGNLIDMPIIPTTATPATAWVGIAATPAQLLVAPARCLRKPTFALWATIFRSSHFSSYIPHPHIDLSLRLSSSLLHPSLYPLASSTLPPPPPYLPAPFKARLIKCFSKKPRRSRYAYIPRHTLAQKYGVFQSYGHFEYAFHGRSVVESLQGVTLTGTGLPVSLFQATSGPQYATDALKSQIQRKHASTRIVFEEYEQSSLLLSLSR
ncbi:hypothetical protein FB446DRAFT_847450 [Lentinula raphanica]|nr:hypothetical protein FB446DRAFT_847450 [Lentinula raphanica]